MKLKGFSFFRTIVPSLILFWLLIALVCFFPTLFTNDTVLEKGFSDTGQIGDTIGGVMGPFIAIIGAFVTFIAFWVQFDANRSQRRDIRIERFENQFYELIKIGRENISEMKMSPNYSGRKIFPKLFVEFKFVHYHVSELMLNYPNRAEDERQSYKYDALTVLNISYLVYYWGIGNNSDKILTPSLRRFASMGLIHHLTSALNQIKDRIRLKVRSSPGKYYKDSYTMKISKQDYALLDENEVVFKYVIFDGHSHRLGHYYRHLFQTVKLVADQSDDLIDEDQKYNYVKTLRSQLTSFEQLLLYYNSCSSIGESWNSPENNFISRFRLIKNIPVPLANFGIDPKEKYENEIESFEKRGIKFFEWDE